MPSSDDDASDGASSDGQEPHHTIAGEGLGDDFDDFEAQGDDDDFGDFDDGFEQSSTVPEPAAPELPSVPKSPFVSSNKYKWSLFEIRHIPPARSEVLPPCELKTSWFTDLLPSSSQYYPSMLSLPSTIYPKP